MLQLQVYYPGEDGARARWNAPQGAHAEALVPQLLHNHPGCERIVVKRNTDYLFTVDASGNRSQP